MNYRNWVHLNYGTMTMNIREAIKISTMCTGDVRLKTDCQVSDAQPKHTQNKLMALNEYASRANTIIHQLGNPTAKE